MSLWVEAVAPTNAPNPFFLGLLVNVCVNAVAARLTIKMSVGHLNSSVAGRTRGLCSPARTRSPLSAVSAHASDPTMVKPLLPCHMSRMLGHVEYKHVGSAVGHGMCHSECVFDRGIGWNGRNFLVANLERRSIKGMR